MRNTTDLIKIAKIASSLEKMGNFFEADQLSSVLLRLSQIDNEENISPGQEEASAPVNEMEDLTPEDKALLDEMEKALASYNEFEKVAIEILPKDTSTVTDEYKNLTMDNLQKLIDLAKKVNISVLPDEYKEQVQGSIAGLEKLKNTITSLKNKQQETVDN